MLAFSGKKKLFTPAPILDTIENKIYKNIQNTVYQHKVNLCWDRIHTLL